MLILFKDDSCTVPSLGCVFAREISYDADDSCLWFSDGDGIWSIPCDRLSAERLIRLAFSQGKLDLSDTVFELDD